MYVYVEQKIVNHPEKNKLLKIKVNGLEDAVNTYLKYRDNYNMKASEYQFKENGKIVDKKDNPVGYISYNGKIWQKPLDNNDNIEIKPVDMKIINLVTMDKAHLPKELQDWIKNIGLIGLNVKELQKIKSNNKEYSIISGRIRELKEAFLYTKYDKYGTMLETKFEGLNRKYEIFKDDNGNKVIEQDIVLGSNKDGFFSFLIKFLDKDNNLIKYINRIETVEKEDINKNKPKLLKTKFNGKKLKLEIFMKNYNNDKNKVKYFYNYNSKQTGKQLKKSVIIKGVSDNGIKEKFVIPQPTVKIKNPEELKI